MHLGVVREQPLLEKELTELAARKRTYVIRVLYVLLLFLIFIVELEVAERVDAGGTTLGIGVKLAATAVALQLAGILVLLPATVCGVITREKERGSLVLLLVTDLEPWEIILQKLGSRLVPMYSLLILSVPMLAIAYAYGGVTVTQIVLAVAMLLLAALQVGSYAVLCSAYCRTTNGAFFATYLGVALGALPQWSWLTAWGHWPDMILGTWGGIAAASQIPALAMYLGSSLLFLLLAKRVLVQRAFVRPQNRLLAVFRRLDRVMNGINRLFGGIHVLKPQRVLPGSQPIAWREFTTQALGRIHYQVRVVIFLEALVILFAIQHPYQVRGAAVSPISNGVYVLWVIAVSLIVVLGTGVVASERSRGTLEVLMTTPMRGWDVVRQKAEVVLRYCKVFWVPFLTLFLLRVGSGDPYSGFYAGRGHTGFYVFASAAVVALALPAVTWIAIAIGLRVQHRVRGILTTYVVIIAWWGAPFFLVFSDFGAPFVYDDLLFGLSPAYLIVRLERLSSGYFFSSGPEVLQYFVALGFFWAVAAVARRYCMDRADKALGRC